MNKITLTFLTLFIFSQSHIYSQVKMDTLSYSLGVLFGNSLKQSGINQFSPADVVEAMEELLAGKTPKLSLQEAEANYRNAVNAIKAKAGEAAKMVGENFLAENKKRAGVITTASGLQYEIIKTGTGPLPKATDKVKTHYHGTLIDGQIFDSSVDRGEPISFPVNGVIQGWQEALQLMPVGSKWKLFVPYNLAYGDRGAGADIKPYAALIFEVELLAIEN